MAGTELMEKMASVAETEVDNLSTAEDVARWIQDWYLKAGYKNLCQILMKKFAS